MNRIYHTWDKWECYPAGFYETKPPHKDMTIQDCKQAYADFLCDHKRFEAALDGILFHWPNSCEHYLTNERMNRIAWLGQASFAQALGLPSTCRGGYNRLTQEKKDAADALALEYLNKWLTTNGRPTVDYEKAGGRTEAELY